MIRRVLSFLIPLLVLATVAPLAAASSNQVWIQDIQANPSRYWNTTVTVTGQVIGAVPNPVGTTRGTYSLLDESSQKPLVIRTDELPPLGKSYAVTGVIIQDPAQATEPLLKELKRSSPSMSSLIKVLLFAGGALFLILLVVFLVLLMRPPKRQAPAPPATVAGPAADPVTPLPPLSPALQTTKMPASPPQASRPAEETQVFMSLGAEIVVDRGPDKGQEYPLHKQVTTIGRPGSRKNDIELTDKTVSKEQASVVFDSESKGFSISNQSTTNPTMVNRSIVTDPVLLDEDAVIDVGMTTLRFRKI